MEFYNSNSNNYIEEIFTISKNYNSNNEGLFILDDFNLKFASLILDNLELKDERINFALNLRKSKICNKIHVYKFNK